MDLRQYFERKKKNTLKMSHTGNGHFMFSIRRFSQDDGSEVQPSSEGVTHEQMLAMREQLQASLDACNEILGRMEEQMKADANP